MESLHSGGLRLSHWRVYGNTTKGEMPIVHVSNIILILFKGMPLNSQSLSPWCSGYCLYVTEHIQIQVHLLISDIECTAEKSLSKSNYHFKTIKKFTLDSSLWGSEEEWKLGDRGGSGKTKSLLNKGSVIMYTFAPCCLLPINIIQCANSK